MCFCHCDRLRGVPGFTEAVHEYVKESLREQVAAQSKKEVRAVVWSAEIHLLCPVGDVTPDRVQQWMICVSVTHAERALTIARPVLRMPSLRARRKRVMKFYFDMES